MFCITLQWWLGNQLFQYAFGQMLAKHYSVKILYDDLNYSSFSIFSLWCMLWLYTPRTLALERFEIQLQRPSRWQRFKLWSTGLHKIAEQFFWRKNKYRKHEQKAYIYDSSRFSIDTTHDRSCGGYRNVARYFEWMRDMLQSQIKLKQESLCLQEFSKTIQQQQQKWIQTVSIHIRGGDYIKLWMVVCDQDYYLQTLKTLENKYWKDSLHIYLFSDDPDNLPIDTKFLETYANTKIIFDDYYKAKNIDQKWFDDVEKFILMSRCQHHIIANSTYSRWAAWLWDSLEMTFAPKMWLKDVSSEEVIPNNWIKI
jgi:Glycosyl transferase family 11